MTICAREGNIIVFSVYIRERAKCPVLYGIGHCNEFSYLYCLERVAT